MGEDFVLVHGGPRDADAHLGGDLGRQRLHVGFLLEEPGEGGHVGAFGNSSRVEEVTEVPLVAAFAGAHVLVFLALRILFQRAAFAGQIGTGAFRAPLIGMVEERLTQMRVVIDDSGAAIAEDIGGEGADHL